MPTTKPNHEIDREILGAVKYGDPLVKLFSPQLSRGSTRVLTALILFANADLKARVDLTDIIAISRAGVHQTDIAIHDLIARGIISRRKGFSEGYTYTLYPEADGPGKVA